MHSPRILVKKTVFLNTTPHLLENPPNVRALNPHFAAGMFGLVFFYFRPPFAPFSPFSRPRVEIYFWKRVFLYGQLNTQGRDCAARTSERIIRAE